MPGERINEQRLLCWGVGHDAGTPGLWERCLTGQAAVTGVYKGEVTFLSSRVQILPSPSLKHPGFAQRWRVEWSGGGAGLNVNL